MRANFETADPTVVITPFIAFFLSAIAATVITSEFTTGSIGPALLAVPQRRKLLSAKVAVAIAVGTAGGLMFTLLAVGAAMILVGDRPTPIDPWPDWTDAISTLVGAQVVVVVTCAVALGAGTLLRSTAATLLTVGGLVLVAPVFIYFLPAVWQPRLSSVLLTNLGSQVVGSNHPYLLSQTEATAVLAVYVVVAIGAAFVSFGRRDAS